MFLIIPIAIKDFAIVNALLNKLMCMLQASYHNLA